MVREINSAAFVKEATGAVFGGPDSSRWDARYYDAVRLIQTEETLIQGAIEDANV